MLDTAHIKMELLKYLKTITVSTDPVELNETWSKLCHFKESLSESNNHLVNIDYNELLKSVLTEEPVQNIEQVPRLLEWFLTFPTANTQLHSISDDIAYFLDNSAEKFHTKPVLLDIIRVIDQNFEVFISKDCDLQKLCDAIVTVLSYMPDTDVDELKYVTDLEEIKEFLIKVHKLEQKYGLSYGCIKTFFMIFQKRDNPSSSLVIVFQLLPKRLWEEFMQCPVDAILCKFKDEEAGIVKMLSHFCRWMFQPTDKYLPYLSRWLSLFIIALDKARKQRITLELADSTLPKILQDPMVINKFREIDKEDNIVFHLIKRIGSLEICHQILELISLYFEESRKTNSQQQVVRDLIETTKILIKRFHNHQQCCICPGVQKTISTYEEENLKNLPRFEECEEMEVSCPSTSTGRGRLEASKVGLLNLNNTCYMNSVLQALAMTGHFCREVLLYKNDLSEQGVLKHLQNLIALLKYSKDRSSIAPTEILQASRPAYFMPGQQQDSSEFLCYLLDVLYEQEKSALMHSSSSDHNIQTKLKVEDKEMIDLKDVPGPTNSLSNDDGTLANIVRWTTEENLSEGASLQRKTQSLADFTQGEELSQTQNELSDSHSNSTDSGIQSVGGEDTSSASSTASASTTSYLVHRVFGGELKITCHCLECNTESHSTDRFRDLQLCFLENLEPVAIRVQDLIKLNYFQPEQLTGDNKYRCDKCAKLCNAKRIVKILQAPVHLILTLKHFRYNAQSRLRTKLRHKVIYDETIELEVHDQNNVTYQLYAAVVHSGYSMDYGHYITYARDNSNHWYKFNDSYVSETTLDDFKRLELPDTPYILFYKRCNSAFEEDRPEFGMLSKSLQDYVHQYRWKSTTKLTTVNYGVGRFNHNNSRDRDKSDDDDDNPPPSNCRAPLNIPNQPCLT